MVKTKTILFFYFKTLDKNIVLWYINNSMIRLEENGSTVVSINGVPAPCENSKSAFDANRDKRIWDVANGANKTAVQYSTMSSS